MLNPSLSIGSASNPGASLTVVDSETNGNAALYVEGGISAGSAKTDGSGLNSGSPQAMWADYVSVPAATTNTLQIYNVLVGPSSTILLTPVGTAAFTGGLSVTSQSAGSFTVSSNVTMGTSGGGVVTAINYVVINH